MPQLPPLPPIATQPLSVVLLAHESPHLAGVVDGWVKFLDGLGRDYEVILVDDASSDRTPERIDNLVKRHPHLRVLRHETHKGEGAALRTGVEAAQHPLLFYTVCEPSFSRRMSLRSSLPHQRTRPWGSTPEHVGPISRTCDRPARVCVPTLSTSSPVYPAFSMNTETVLSGAILYSTLSMRPATSRKPLPCPSRTQVVPSLIPKPAATRSILASGAIRASSSGSARVMLAGLGAGAGPSPRIPPV